MNNLVMGTALNYDVQHVKPFVMSLRKHYDGEVIFLVNNTSKEFDDFLQQYDIKKFTIDRTTNNQDEICSMRHNYYRQVVEYYSHDYILLTDVRDVVFQKNPFSHEITTDLEFFREPNQYKNCECHRHWFCDLNIHGCDFYKSIADETIICAGTTIGTKKGMIEYLHKMIDELAKMNRIITDQPTHAYLILDKSFTNCKLYDTFKGPVATLSKSDNLRFDSDNHLLNEDGSVVAIVHQWDRTPQKDIFYSKAIS